MQIKQFEDKALSHYSYAIISGNEMAVVDPARNPMQYYQFAEENNAEITTVFETHPHADFVSSHDQIHRETGAIIYVSKLLGADYPHKTFDKGDELKLGNIKLSALNTPGHSPDSICILAENKDEKVLLTGDTLFIGNVGRPDLREKSGNMQAKQEELAKQMYHTMQNKFNNLPDETKVYPAHGAGSLCGKGMSKASSSTLGNERLSNWAFQDQSEAEFLDELLDGQPMIPHYFSFAVEVNKKGPENFRTATGRVPFFINQSKLPEGNLVVDIREQSEFKDNHLPGSINIQAVRPAQKLETWLGATVQPGEKFYLVVPSIAKAEEAVARVAKIGYEKQLLAVVTLAANIQSFEEMDFSVFKQSPENYTIVDIRNAPEFEEKQAFDSAINIQLHELRERSGEVPKDKPVVVHCAAGYRSAAGSSILKRNLSDVKVLDLSDHIKEYF